MADRPGPPNEPPSGPPPGPPPSGPPGFPAPSGPPGAPPGMDPPMNAPPGLPPGLQFEDPAIVSQGAKLQSPPAIAPPGPPMAPPSGYPGAPGMAAGTPVRPGPPGLGAPPGMGMKSPAHHGPPPGIVMPPSPAGIPPGLMSPYKGGGKGSQIQMPVQLGPNQPRVLPTHHIPDHIVSIPQQRLKMMDHVVRDDGEVVDILTTNLVELVDQKVVVQMNDGRTIVGQLRSFDNFANLVLEHSVERHIVDHFYADLYLGCMLIRGENVVMVADIQDGSINLTKISMPELLEKEDALLTADPDTALRLDWDFLDDFD